MIIIKAMCCDCEHDKEFHLVRENGSNTYVVVLIKTKAVVGTQSGLVHVEPNTVIVYNISSRQEYGADGQVYSDDYLAFECNDRTFAKLSHIMDKPIYVGDSIKVDSYMHLICDAFYGGRSERIYTNLINAMLEDIASLTDKSDKQSAHFGALVELRKEIYSAPQQDWNVKLMADRVMLSVPYLQELYKDAFGISPIADVINSRVESAKIYLSDMSLSIAEIATMCGYNSTVHFSRQFRNVTGMSPAEFRKS